MNKDSLTLLQRILDAPSPSGFEQPVGRLIAQRLRTFCDDVRADVLGNVIGVINPDAETRVMLAGHCDEIGMMITNITNEGYIYFSAVGGFEPITVLGQRVLIHNERGPVCGVVGRPAIHLISKSGAKPNEGPKLHELWIDIGARNRKDAEKAVAIGDYVTVEANFRRLRNDLVVGRACDDRVGAFIVAEAMRLLARQKKKLRVAAYGVATTQEELGLRGAKVSAHGIDPHAGIAVDMGFATDYPTADKNLTGDIAIGKGPVIAKGPNINAVLGKMLVDAAKKHKIPYQIEGISRATGTDANVIQMTRAGVAAALVSVPNRYMHTPVEVVGLKDVENSAKLLAATVVGMKGKTDFRPKM